MAINPNTIINAINKGIALNPTTFTVKKEEKILVDGAYDIVETEVEYTGIIYFEESSSSINIISETIGTEYKQNNWHMILDNQTEIKTDENNMIKFTVDEGTFILKAVNPFVIQKTLCGYLCDLEKIN